MTWFVNDNPCEDTFRPEFFEFLYELGWRPYTGLQWENGSIMDAKAREWVIRNRLDITDGTMPF